MSLSRRALLGGLAAGCAVTGLTGLRGLTGMTNGVAHAAPASPAPSTAGEVKPATPGQVQRFAQVGGDFSWKPHKLDAAEVAKLAHDGYHHQAYG